MTYYNLKVDNTRYDWKSSNKVPNRERLIDDIQTRLYPVVLSEAYQTDLPIRLIIWEIIAPDAPFVFFFFISRTQAKRPIFQKSLR